MPLLSDAVEAQRSQYPYYLPPTAEQEALQPSNILGDLTRRWAPAYSNFWFGRYGPQVTNVLASVLPMAMMAPTEGAAGGVSGLTEALSGRNYEPPSARIGPWYEWQKTTPVTEPFATQPYFPPGWRTPEAGAAPSAMTPVTTTPLQEAGVVPKGWHGSQEAIEAMAPPEQVSAAGNLYGPGLYTTMRQGVAEGYATPPGSRSPGVVYRISEINPVKLFDVDKETQFPPGTYERVAQLLKDKPVESQQVWSGYNNPRARKFGSLKPGNVFKSLAGDDPIWGNVREALQQAMEEKGYAGITHKGGAITGTPPHQVRIYWQPSRDVRMRAIEPYWTHEVGKWQEYPPSPEHPSGYFDPKFHQVTTKVPAPAIEPKTEDWSEY